MHPGAVARTLELSASAGTARPARAVVRDLCMSASLGEDVSEAAVLLTTELVMNALQHGGGRALVDAALVDGALRVTVADDDPTEPTPKASPESLDSERGRGLVLVAAMASRWGTRPLGDGKSVWFELDPA